MHETLSAFLLSLLTYNLTERPYICSFRFCWAESYVDFLLPATECSTSGPLRLLQKQRERERWPSRGSFLLDVLKLWNSERICTSLVSPRTFFLLHTYTHTPLSPQNPAWMTATFSGPQILLLEQWREKSKRNSIRPTYNDQAHWTLKGNTDVKSPTRTKLFK